MFLFFLAFVYNVNWGVVLVLVLVRFDGDSEVQDEREEKGLGGGEGGNVASNAGEEDICAQI